MINYSVAKEYTETPGGRYRMQSEFSGEDFRETVLAPLYERAKSEDTMILINLDGTYGYPPCFLEEAFGGLARQYPNDIIIDRFRFISFDNWRYVDEIEEYVYSVMAFN